MRRLFGGLTAAALLAVSVAVPAALAQDVDPHQHYIVRPNGTQVAVASAFCTRAPQTNQGLQQFHSNVHFGSPTTQGFTQPNNPVAWTFVPSCP